MNNFEIDALSRRMVVENTDTNLFVEAGAGSGKTTMLVSRMVAMVEAGKDISKISAITFTKAAALEFYERFQTKLSERSKFPNDYQPKYDGDLPLISEESASRCERALNNIDLCFMGTLDSFCNMVLSEHPSAAKLPSGSSITSKEELSELYKIEYSKIINGTDEILKEKGKLFASFHSNPAKVFAESISSILPIRNINMIYDRPSCSFDVDAVLKQEKASIVQMVEAVLNLEDYGTQTKTTQAALESLRNNAELIKDSWNDKLNSIIYVLKDMANLRIPVSAAEANIDHHTFFVENEGRGKWFNFNTDDIYYPYAFLNELKYQATLDFVISACDTVSNSLKKQGKLSFSDYLIYLRDVLKGDARNGGKLAKHIYDRHSYFLIDEFQDTNPIQSEIFFYLTAIESNDNWMECIPRPGSLFIVGDPKQSIYRFRQADVESFLKIKKLFSDPKIGRAIYLKRNFRSSRCIREYFNRVFPNILKESNIQSGYEEVPINDFESDDQNLLTGIYKYHFKSGKKIDESEKDEVKVAEIINRLVNSKYLIKTAKENSLRKIKYSDFMIITPAKGTLKNFMSEFRKNDIPFNVEGDVQFANTESLRSVFGIYNYLVDGSNINRYKALKSPIFNISESVIYMNDKNYISNIEAKMNSLSNEMSAYMPSALFIEILKRFNVLEKVSNENLEYLFYTLELIRNKESNNEINSHKDAIDFIEKELLDSEKEIERSISLTDSPDCVWLANLHKVKGLEKPIVILTGKTSSKKANIRIERNGDHFDGYIFNLNNSISSNKYESKENEEKICLDAEKDRLRYVAATRAGSVLIIASQDGGETTRMWDSLIEEKTADISAALFDKNEEIIKPQFVKFNFDNTKVEFNKKGPSFEYKTPSTIKSHTISHPDYQIKGDKIATIKGTMIHKMMEILVLSKNKIKKESLIKNIVNDHAKEDQDKYEEILNNVYDVITGGGYDQKSNTPKDILNVLLNADEVYTEVPFTLKMEYGVLTGIIDVIYLENNNWHILDYKTNYDDDNLEERYKPQLEAYKNAFEEIEGICASTEIYHIDAK